jgi:hypothetical protein
MDSNPEWTVNKDNNKITELRTILQRESQNGRPLRNIHISNDNGSFYTYYFLSSITYDTFMMGQGFFSSLFCWVGVGFCLFVFFAFDLCLMCTMLPVFLDYSVITVFTVFRLLTDFVCLHSYEFWLSLCFVVLLSVFSWPIYCISFFDIRFWLHLWP